MKTKTDLFYLTVSEGFRPWSLGPVAVGLG